MTNPQPPPPLPRPFQFTLRTLLLLFVVLGSSLAVFGVFDGGTVAFAVVVGLALYLRCVKSFSSLSRHPLLVFCPLMLTALLLPAANCVHRGLSPAMRCGVNLERIFRAMQQYHQVHGCFPPAYVADKDGKPMHSWRTLILPYLDREGHHYADLYKAYNFAEPWDGPNNRKLLADRPSVFACPSDPIAGQPNATQTSYLAVVGPGTAWPGKSPQKLDDIDAPTWETVMLIEVSNSEIGWTEPRDLSVDTLGTAGSAASVLDLSSHHARRSEFFFTFDQRAGVNLVMADGHIAYMPPDPPRKTLKKMLLIGGYNDDKIQSRCLEFEYIAHVNWPNIAALAVWLLSVGTLLVGVVRGRKARPA